MVKDDARKLNSFLEMLQDTCDVSSEEENYGQDRIGLEMSRDKQMLVTNFYRSVDSPGRASFPDARESGLFSYN